jgi:hypothetical protein
MTGMSIAVLDRELTLAKEVAELRERLGSVEHELELLQRERAAASESALHRLQESWAAMSPEDQAEATQVFEAAERESRAWRVDD